MARPLAIALCALGAACSDPVYDVRVHVPGGGATAIRVELSVLRSCEVVSVMGAPVDGSRKTVTMSGEGGASLGFVEEGSYGLYGRAWRSGCVLYAAGCSPFRVDGDRADTIELFLEPATFATDETCDDVPVPACGDVKAFPTAEGAGAATIGGRGGRVAEVTTLADSGPGSLREALEQAGPRTIVFRVAGTIDLDEPIRLREAQSFVTVAGQTAPGEGIQLRRNGIILQGGVHDVVLRHLKIRPGLESEPRQPGLHLYGDEDEQRVYPVSNVIVDHCSIQWSAGDNISINGSVSGVTIQWSLLAEPLTANQIADATAGGLQAKADGLDLTLHHDLFAHNQGYSPGIHQAVIGDVRNNVAYNWSCNNGAQFGNGSEDDVTSTGANLVGNVYRDGPESNCGDFIYLAGSETQLYVEDNLGRNCPSGCEDEWDFGFMDHETLGIAVEAVYRSLEPLPAAPVATDPIEAVFELVLGRAGADRPTRDEVDARIVEEVRDGTGRSGRGGEHPDLPEAEPPADGDRDGMPDTWELARGLDPAVPADRSADDDGNGYTDLEDYLNELAGDPVCR